MILTTHDVMAVSRMSIDDGRLGRGCCADIDTVAEMLLTVVPVCGDGTAMMAVLDFGGGLVM